MPDSVQTPAWSVFALAFAAAHAAFFVAPLLRVLQQRIAPRAPSGTVAPREVRSGHAFALLVLHGAGLVALYAAVVFAVWRGDIVLAARPLQLLGLAIVLLGDLLGTWAVAVFASWSIGPGVRAGHELCTRGPFALVRHPIYAALSLLGVGTLLVVPTWPVFASAVLLVIGGWARGRAEERVLLEAFGDAYADYLARVPRFAPRLVRLRAAADAASARFADATTLRHRYYALNDAAYAWFAPGYDWMVRPLRRKREQIARLVGDLDGRRVVDVATGTGEQALAFAARGAAVVGIDLSEDMLRIARRKDREQRVQFENGDATRLRFADGELDVSSISFALHEMPPDVRSEVVRELVRVTRPGGVVLVVDYGVPPKRWLARIACRLIALYERERYREFLRTDLEALLRSHGVDVDSTQVFYGGTVRAIVGHRAVAARMGTGTDTGERHGPARSAA